MGAIFFAERPALVSSSNDLYGRPAMIFLAVAAPTPLTASSSCWVAVLISTRPFWAWALPRLKARTATATSTPTAHRQKKWEGLLGSLTMRFLLING